jgi:hypothetical protein
MVKPVPIPPMTTLLTPGVTITAPSADEPWPTIVVEPAPDADTRTNDLSIVMFSLYVPASTEIVSPAAAASMAD